MTNHLELALQQEQQVGQEQETDALEQALRPVRVAAEREKPAQQRGKGSQGRRQDAQGEHPVWWEGLKADDSIGQNRSPSFDRGAEGLTTTGRGGGEGWTGEAARKEQTLPLLEQLKGARRRAKFVEMGSRTVTIPAQEDIAAEEMRRAEEFDRLVERDARRYDGGFPLY